MQGIMLGISTSLVAFSTISGYISALTLDDLRSTKKILLTASSFSLVATIILGLAFILVRRGKNIQGSGIIALLGLAMALLLIDILYIVAFLQLRKSKSKISRTTAGISLFSTLFSMILVGFLLMSSIRKTQPMSVQAPIESINPVLVPPYSALDGAAKQLQELQTGLQMTNL